MSLIRKQFYNIFWKNNSCQNLFLLSKEELLETTSIGTDEHPFSYSLNRIIISNAEKKEDDIDTIKFRNENNDLIIGNSLDQKVAYFKPIVEKFFEENYKKAFDKLKEDIENRGWKFFIQTVKLLSNPNKIENNLIKLLQKYGFIGQHIKSLEEVENHFKNQFIPHKGNKLINEETINTFLEGIKFIKEIYVNQSYKNLYNTNQILINTLNSEDNFESRLKMFHLLYESKILLPSNDDAFIECSNCEPGTYKGVFQLHLNPNKLSDLKCPVCRNQLTYFVPYKLQDDIYKIVKEKDGLLQDALCFKLDEQDISYKLNRLYLGDIEIDCMFEIANQLYVVETKMYKINTARNKLKSKVKKHFNKLAEDIERLSEIDEFKNKNLAPMLLVNIPDKELLGLVNTQLKTNPSNPIYNKIKIVNLELLKFGTPVIQ